MNGSPPILENLVIKMARLLGMRWGLSPSLTSSLPSQSPTEAGLCGGSAVAAADLVGCNLSWEANLSDDILAVLGAKISERRAFLHQRNVGTRYET